MSPTFFIRVLISSLESQFLPQSPNFFIRIPISESQFLPLHHGPDFFIRVSTTSLGSQFHSPNFFIRVSISECQFLRQSHNFFIGVPISESPISALKSQFLHQSIFQSFNIWDWGRYADLSVELPHCTMSGC